MFLSQVFPLHSSQNIKLNITRKFATVGRGELTRWLCIFLQSQVGIADRGYHIDHNPGLFGH